MPFNGKNLKAYLRERNVGIVTVKEARHGGHTGDTDSPTQAERERFSRTPALTRYAGQQIVMICEDYQPV